MQLFDWVAALLLVTAVLAVEAPVGLVVETTYQPPAEECEMRARNGDEIHVHYTGKLFDTGAKFDSSHDRGKALMLTLGTGQVIRGWDQGLQGMCLDEKRTLTIPSDMAYGPRGFGTLIPPNSALVFDVELVGLGRSTHDEL